MKNEEKQKSTTEAVGYAGGITYAMTHSLLGGKPISASIIVLAGSILILGGSHIGHSDTRLFCQFLGCIVGVVGLSGMIVSLREKLTSAIGSSVLVLAAAILMLGSISIGHSDTRLFVQIVGCIVGLVGLGGWVVSAREQ